MEERSTKFAVLRDKRNWDEYVSHVNLAARADGAFLLNTLPGSSDAASIRLPTPYEVSLSGIAIGTDDIAYAATTKAAGQITVSISGCDAGESICGAADGTEAHRFNLPSGMLIVGNRLFVADSGNHRVLVLDLPSFRFIHEWTNGLQSPTCVVTDSADRIYVLDAGQQRVLRFDQNGAPDGTYNTAMATHVTLQPVCIAIDSSDVLYATDAAANTVSRFDINGAALADLDLAEPIFKPRALVVSGARLYVADAESGYIFAFDTEKGFWLGKLVAYRGPVTALAVNNEGVLYVKPGIDEVVYRLDADTARVQSGSLVAGPFDAGIESAWERVWVDADIPEQAGVLLELAASDDRAIPAEDKWEKSPSLDVLLRTVRNIDAPRYLWIRVTLTSLGRSTPTLLQVQAATAEPSYLDYLPAIYRRDDSKGFLQNWLALFRSELGDWERELEELSRQFDSRTAAEQGLDELASWLALKLPQRLDAPEQRQLLADVQDLYRRRGTPMGIRELARRYIGAQIHIFEAFRERRVWQLGQPGSSRLGIDSALPAGTPDGLIVPGYTYADRSLSGLRGEYYSGTKFENLRYTRIDPRVNFAWTDQEPLLGIVPTEKLGADNFSVRWSGQVRSRYSETYTFRTRSDDGVRLWVNNRLIVDNWTLHAATDNAGQIRLEANRWYPIVIEFFEQSGYAQMELSWSSPSQRSEIVPEECLYPIIDESIEVEPEHHGGCELMEVGHAVVGESRPQTADDFGAPLSDDFAHLFIVTVPAAQVRLASQRHALRELIESEKPAHTDYRLCLAEPRMRVGVQARVGIDSIVAGGGPPMRTGAVELGIDSYLGGDTPQQSSKSHPTEAVIPV